MEDNEKTDLWIDLDPSQSVVFWPDTLSMQIFVKYRDSNLISQAVFTSRQHKTVLRMDKGTALTVDVTGGSSGPFLITFHEYTPGDCPVLVRNYCEDLYLKIQQKDQSHVSLLNPGHSLLYTWDNPVLSRVLTWNIYNNKGSGFILDIHKDSYGEEKIKFQSVTPTSSLQESSSSDDSDSSGSTPNKLNKKVRKDKIVIYWACFVEGSQRVLLFTQEQRIFENVLTTRFKELCTLETILSISGIGLSLFTSDTDIKEHLYASLCDSPSIWEVNVGHKWKTLTLELASWIEDKYKRSLTHKKCQIKDYVHIDFEKMFMLKPFFAEIRRTYIPAVYCHFRKSPKFQYIDFRLNYLQIDNKHSNCIVFQPVFHSSEVPNNHSLVKAVTFKQTEQNFQNYRYIKINLSDISLNIENDLWSTVAELLKDNQKFGRDYSSASAYVEDLTAIKRNLSAKLCNEAIADTRQKPAQIELMALSSFGVQLTISNRIQMSSTSSTMRINRVLNYLFPHNMAPYMPLEGVHHKVASAEWMDSNQDTSSVIEGLINHVTGRFLQQYYSQVLGLQVLVNSFDRQTGVEAVLQGTSNVASTIFYGFQCFLGHIVMSPAALETCILDVFPNFNIEQASHSKHSIKRASVTVVRNNNDSAILPKSIAKTGRSFEVAVPIALSQLFIKSYNANSYCDGEMFFKTSGKALISLITKHQDEKSDFVEIAKESLRRAFILGEPIRIHQRLTRYRTVLGLTPFSVYESMGHYLLETIGNSRFSNDKYWAHAAIDKTGKSLIIVSLEHIVRVNKCTLWSSWEIEWEMDLDDIISMPKMNSVELIINIRQNEAIQGEQQIKISGPKEILAWLHEKIEQAIILSMEDKSWALQKFD